ncbi:sugar ABC transporter ATP-binding protein [Ureibacillus massiliensis 4400831 = CIP 108448 = CCUG 49529]|uniref:Sugar ABC transporter ATP-binding protein n=1 Tax=Ureibacillus massiliensis 4400831 = CIP 108448 = CCUG 49529 TaxID=1211035 RepID=A0A0A3JPM5_9BACL|nr:sn-glycerol-3-phosphate ABC transporter ATP-binding protein UgpC [Ureibacillus massiliensis]KGR88977.1 sugar ABC transporter ATP-binding protein [Ureibacillus massiliensis 4400831 = CIP 108448 = CCUG 49529]
MANLLLKEVSKIYDGGVTAVHHINLDIKDKEFIVLVGPSGCGKSTTLRMIAGLENISDGELFIGDKLVNTIPSKDRDIAMVFQNYALYPHMTVRENMGFALKMKKVSKSEINEKVEKVAEILELKDYLNRKPGALSGGQRQRVALGRAMVRNPKVFLLDEPLSNLDAKLRVTMRSEIVKLHRQLETTFVYVTHDQTEAMTMGDRIAVMRGGILEQFDTPRNLYKYPKNLFVAQFIGSPQMNIFKAKLLQGKEGVTISIAGQNTVLPTSILDRLEYDSEMEDVYLGVRPEAFHFTEQESESEIVLDIEVKNVEQVGSDTYVYFDHSDANKDLVARLNPARDVLYGDKVKLSFNLDSIYLFDIESEETILRNGELV